MRTSLPQTPHPVVVPVVAIDAYSHELIKVTTKCAVRPPSQANTTPSSYLLSHRISPNPSCKKTTPSSKTTVPSDARKSAAVEATNTAVLHAGETIRWCPRSPACRRSSSPAADRKAARAKITVAASTSSTGTTPISQHHRRRRRRGATARPPPAPWRKKKRLVSSTAAAAETASAAVDDVVPTAHSFFSSSSAGGGGGGATATQLRPTSTSSSTPWRPSPAMAVVDIAIGN
uniref:Uncharacterized protein n=1 Tax=Oryza meridionalis TaxID=40149 RepID=A0A0E0CG61_9ORYZ